MVSCLGSLSQCDRARLRRLSLSAEQVAIIVPAYNAASLLSETLASLLRQRRVAFRVYLVDDGSTDRTPEVARAQFVEDRRLTYICQENRGQAAAINRGIRAGPEPLITLCDADDLWREDRLERVVAAYERDPTIGLICNDFFVGTDPGQPWISAWQTRGYRPVSGHAFESLLEQNFIPRSGVSIPPGSSRKSAGSPRRSPASAGRTTWTCGSRSRRRWPILCLDEVLTFKRVWAGQDSTTMPRYGKPRETLGVLVLRAESAPEAASQAGTLGPRKSPV